MEKTIDEKKEMTIKIQTMDSSFPITLPKTSTVQQLKDIISSKYTIPQINQRLIFQGKLMQNEKALSFYKITDECVIHLVAKSLEEVNSNNTNDVNNQNNLNNQQVNNLNLNNNNNSLQYEEMFPVIQIPFRSTRRRRRIMMPHFDISESFEALYQNMISIDNLSKCKKIYSPNINKIEVFDFSKTKYEVGQWVDVKDTIEQWLEAQVMEVQNNKAYVHYNGWGTRWDEWIEFSSPRMRNFKIYTLQSPGSVFMSPYPGIPCDSNIQPQTRNIDCFFYLEKLQDYLKELYSDIQKLVLLRKKNKYSLFNDKGMNFDDKEILFKVTQVIPFMDRIGRMLSDISLQFSHLVVNPSFYPQMILGYKREDMFKGKDEKKNCVTHINQNNDSFSIKRNINIFDNVFDKKSTMENEERTLDIKKKDNTEIKDKIEKNEKNKEINIENKELKIENKIENKEIKIENKTENKEIKIENNIENKEIKIENNIENKEIKTENKEINIDNKAENKEIKIENKTENKEIKIDIKQDKLNETKQEINELKNEPKQEIKEIKTENKESNILKKNDDKHLIKEEEEGEIKTTLKKEETIIKEKEKNENGINKEENNLQEEINNQNVQSEQNNQIIENHNNERNNNRNHSQSFNGTRTNQRQEQSIQPQNPIFIQTNLGYNLTSSSSELPFIQRIITSYTINDRTVGPSSHIAKLISNQNLFPKVNLQVPGLLSSGEVMMMTGYTPYSEPNFDIYVHTIISNPRNNDNTNNNQNNNNNNQNNNNNNNSQQRNFMERAVQTEEIKEKNSEDK